MCSCRQYDFLLDCSAAVWTSTQIVVGRKKLQQIPRAMLDWIKLLLVASLQIWWIYHLHFSAAHEPQPRYHGRSVAKSAHIIVKHSNKSPILDSISNQFLRERCSWLLHFNLSVFFWVSQSFLGCGLEFWLLYLAKTNWKSTHSTHMDLL